MDWEAWRDEFPTLSRKTYLNTCSLGCLSRRSREAVNRFLDLWTEYGASAWYEIWLGEVQATREKFARLIGARPDEVGIAPNVSTALAAFASALDLSERPEVVSADLDFPTIPYQWLARSDADVRFARSPDGVRVPAPAYEELMGDRTALVATSHVFFTTGAIVDAGAVARAAHDAGGLMLLDAYQGTGQLPTDVRALDVDFYVSGGLKWLLGGPGISYFYVRRELHDRLTPETVGWFGHEDQFRFDPADWRPARDARRFELGTPATAAVYAGSAGLDIVHEIGPERLRRRTMHLVRDLRERLADAGLEILAPEDPHEATGIVPIRCEEAKRVVQALADDGIIVDSRPGRIRISPYFYNTEEENQRTVDALRKAGA